MLIMLSEETDLDFIREMQTRNLINNGFQGEIDVDTLYNIMSEIRGDKEKIVFMLGDMIEMVIDGEE